MVEIQPTDINRLISQGMGPGLHWFPEDVPLSRLAATLVGMANTNGGVVLLGISPRSAQVLGVASPEEAIDRVFQAALLPDPPLVLPLPSVLYTPDVTPIIQVVVPAGLPNVYSLDGSYLGREGRQTNPLPARRLRQLLMERGMIQFESRVPAGARLEDLDRAAVQEYLDLLEIKGVLIKGELSAEDILARRGCLQKIEAEFQPTYAGLLLFGSCPQQWLPSASILAARFSGITFVDRFIKQDFSGNLIQQLRQAEIFLHANLQTVVRMIGMAHQEVLEYPFEAVRELLVNAIAHRDYNFQGDTVHLNIFSDRLEVQSPGGLPGPVNLDNLLQARFSRNAVIVQVLSDFGFVERLGYGLDRVMTVLKQENLRTPRFEETAGCFRVTLFGMDEPQLPAMLPDLAYYRSLELNSRQKMMLNYLAQNQRINSSVYQELCPDVHPETLRRDLVDLVQRGVLLKVGDKRATYYILKSHK